MHPCALTAATVLFGKAHALRNVEQEALSDMMYRAQATGERVQFPANVQNRAVVEEKLNVVPDKTKAEKKLDVTDKKVRSRKRLRVM